jgi:YidC/Oxa1 family membrane protein insertase
MARRAIAHLFAPTKTREGYHTMERRAFLAVILMFLVLIMYEVMMRPARVRDPGPAERESPVTVADEPVDIAPEEIPVGETMEADEGSSGVSASPATLEKRVVVETDLIRAVLSNRGPRVLSWKLKKFPGLDSDWVELVPDSLEGGLFLGIGSWVDDDERAAVLECHLDQLILNEGRGTGELMFTGTMGDGRSVTEVLTFENSSYLVDLKISVGDAAAERGDGLRLGWISSLPSTEPNRRDAERYFAGMASVDSEVLKVQVKNLKKEETRLRRGTVHWVGLKTKYFASVLVPSEESASAVEMGGMHESERLGFSVLFPAKQDGGWHIESQLYVGPIDYRILKDLHLGLDKFVDFGHKIIRPLSKLIYWMLVTVYNWIPNYGVVIIILSAFTKFLFYPLTQKSMKSMQRMQELQPKMAALKEKYKSDPKRMNQEVMKLYKEQGVNPVGGCLPLLLQSPVFFALYAVLQRTIELRRAPFALWIDDLSRPDVIFSLPPPLPALSLLPILMGVSMLLQQRLSASAGAADPRQKMMGYMMPIFLTVIFFRMPSGLVLYWLVNTVLSIGQQYLLVRRGRAAQEVTPE